MPGQLIGGRRRGSADGRQDRSGSYAEAVTDGMPTQAGGPGSSDDRAATPPNHQQPEDVEATVDALLNSAYPGLNMQTSDIDRAH